MPAKKKFNTLAEAFYDKCKISDTNSCIEWEGIVGHFGYGNLKYNKKMLRAHRVSYELFNGHLSEGKIICHRCNNPKCVNPKHLYAGTHKQNHKDRQNGQRALKGENHGRSKLTEKQVLEIREKYRPYKVTNKMLAKAYDVHVETIKSINIRKNWRHI